MALTTTGRARPGLQRKIAALLLVVVGAVLIAVTLVDNLFKVGPAFEGMMKDFRPVLTQQSLSTARADVAGLAAVDTEFRTKLSPTMAQQLKMTPDQFSAFIAQQFPKVASGLQALPQMTPTFSGLITTLDKQRPLFASADAIPTKDLPATTVPWGLLVAGLLCMGVGVLVWMTRRAGAVAAIVLGLLLVIAPLVMSLPGKASDADQLNKNLKPVYTQTMVTQAKGALTTVGAMASDLQTAMLPALATQLKMPPADLQQFMLTNFPATAAGLVMLPQSMARFEHLTAVFNNNLDNYATLKPVRFVPIIWTLIFSGVAVLLLGLWTWVMGGAPGQHRVVTVPSARTPTEPAPSPVDHR